MFICFAIINLLLSKQGECSKPVVLENIQSLKQDQAISQGCAIVQKTPEVTLELIQRYAQTLSPAQRAEAIKFFTPTCTPGAGSNSPLDSPSTASDL